MSAGKWKCNCAGSKCNGKRSAGKGKGWKRREREKKRVGTVGERKSGERGREKKGGGTMGERED